LDNEDMKDELINQITASVWERVGAEHAKIVQQTLYVFLTGYELRKSCTEVVVQNHDETAELIKRFLIAKKIKGCTDRTLTYYRQTLVVIFSKIGKSPMQTETDDIRTYIAKRQMQDKVKDTTVNNEIRNLSSFYEWMQSEEIRLKNPMKRIEQVREYKTKKEAFTDLEVETMRAELQTNREKAMYELLLSTWCRVSELSQILLSEINDGKILVHGKGKKDRIVYINAKAKVALEAYLQERKDSNPYLFAKRVPITEKRVLGPRKAEKNWYQNKDLVDETQHFGAESIEDFVRKLGRSKGIKAHPHKFRRTGATFALRAGMPIEQVSKLLGHSNITTTQIYLDIREEDAAAAHERWVR